MGILTLDAVAEHNRAAWDREVENRNRATIPVTPEQMAAALGGRVSITLTGSRPLPNRWIDAVNDSNVLCLACGGGQQVPLLAAAGARVTSLDNSPRQLDRDRDVISEYGLAFRPILGDMRDLSCFNADAFDFVFLGLATQFVPDPAPIWREICRVLRQGCHFIAALSNPVAYTLDWLAYQRGVMTIAHPLPYSDLHSLSQEERRARFDPDDPLEFGHTLETQLGGIIASDMCIDGFFEDVAREELTSKFFATYFVIRAKKFLAPWSNATADDRRRQATGTSRRSRHST